MYAFFQYSLRIYVFPFYSSVHREIGRRVAWHALFTRKTRPQSEKPLEFQRIIHESENITHSLTHLAKHSLSYRDDAHNHRHRHPQCE